MEKSVTMKFELVENGLVVRKREGNKWGSARWVVGFMDPLEGLFGSETIVVGRLVRDALFGKQAELEKSGEK